MQCGALLTDCCIHAPTAADHSMVLCNAVLAFLMGDRKSLQAEHCSKPLAEDIMAAGLM